MDIMERITPGAAFDSNDVIEERLTALLVRMHDVMQCQPAESSLRGIIQSWRNDIVVVRSALDELRNREVTQ